MAGPDLAGRVALVTGAGSGIGAAIARRLASAGATVGVHYRSSEGGAAVVVEQIRKADGEAACFQADLTREEQVDRLVDAVESQLGPLRVLINNAGVYPSSPLLETGIDEWDAVLGANLTAAFLCTRAVARGMVARGSGAIVNIASIEALTPARGHSHYTAAKAGLVMLTRTTALELGPSGVRANAVSPGLIAREGIELAWPEGVEAWQAACPLGRMGTGADVADACLFLASDAARWITGVNLPVDGGVLSTRPF